MSLSKAKLLEIDGHGSGFDADTLDTKHASDFAPASLITTVNQLSNPNMLINGDFQVWQRGTSFGSVGYTADRWYAFAAGETVERAINTAPFHTQYMITLRRTTTTGYCALTQLIENLEPITGKQLTLSFYAKGSGGFAGSVFAMIGNASIAVPITSEWQKYQVTVNSFVIGSYIEHKGIAFSLYTEAGKGVSIACVKLEYGNIATPFSPRMYAEELALCYRYYLILPNNRFLYSIANGATYYFVGNMVFPIPMRIDPTITLTGSTVSNIGTPSTYGIYIKSLYGIFQTFCTAPTAPQTGYWQAVNGYADAEMY